MNNKEEKILYFGYGAMASPKLMEALLGRKIVGKTAYLSSYGIFVSNWMNIPPEVKSILLNSWSVKDNFSHYSIKVKRGSVVQGKVFSITPKERIIVGEWNLYDLPWFSPIKVLIKSNGRTLLAETETIIEPESRIYYVSGTDYPLFLNKKSKMLNVARKVHQLCT